MEITIKKLNDKAIIPFRATPDSAGADLYACIDNDIVIKPSERILVPTGLSMEIPAGYAGFVFPRSGTASKYGITLSNCVGVVDSDYRGELKIAIINLSDNDYVISNGDRVAQLVVMPVDMTTFIETDNLSETKRNSGGFGSTGKR